MEEDENDQELSELARRALLFDEHLNYGTALFLGEPKGFIHNPHFFGYALEECSTESCRTHHQLDEDEFPLPSGSTIPSRSTSTSSRASRFDPIIFQGTIVIKSDEPATGYSHKLKGIMKTHFLQVFYVHAAACYDANAQHLPWYIGVSIAWYPRGIHNMPYEDALWRSERYQTDWHTDQNEKRLGLLGILHGLRHALYKRLDDLGNNTAHGMGKVILFTDCGLRQLEAIEQVDRNFEDLDKLQRGDRTLYEIHLFAKWLCGYAIRLEIHSVPTTAGIGISTARHEASKASRETRRAAADMYNLQLPPETPRYVHSGRIPGDFPGSSGSSIQEEDTSGSS